MLPALLAGMMIALAVHLALRRSPLPAIPFVVVALVVSVALRLVYSANVDPEWISDFARYWKSATELAGSSLSVADAYQQRALPYLYPLVRLFGDDPEVVKLANIGLLCLIQLAGYDIVRRAAGHAAAQCFTLLWIAAPEPLYSLTIPTHDLSGLAFAALAVWLVAIGLDVTGNARRWRRPALLSLLGLAVGILLVILEIQRGLGILLLATLVVSTLAWVLTRHTSPDAIGGPRLAFVNLLVIVCIAVPVYMAGKAAAESAGFSRSAQVSETGRLRYTTSHSVSFSNGSYWWMRGFHDTFTRHYMDDPEAFGEFRRSLMLSDFVENPVSRATNAADRLDGLYQLGAGMTFYTAGLRESEPQLLKSLQSYNHAFAFAFAALALLALIGLLSQRGPPPIVAVLMLFAALLSIGLAFMAENQPRYAFPVWLVGSIVIAVGLTSLPALSAVRSWPGQLGRAASLAGQALAIPIIVLGLAWLACAITYRPGDGRILTDWEFSPPASIASQRTPTSVLQEIQKRTPERSFYPLALTLGLPDSSGNYQVPSTASTTICVDDTETTNFSFFMQREAPTNGHRTPPLVVTVGGEPVWSSASTGGGKVRLVTIPHLLRKPGCADVALAIETPVTGVEGFAHASSEVEIFFPRLTD